MIFLWGLYEDTPMNMVLNNLKESAADFIFFNSRRIFYADIEFEYDNAGIKCVLYSEGSVIDITKVKAAYLRPHNFRDFGAMQNKPVDDPVAIKAARLEMQLLSYFNSSDAVVINKSDPSATNGSKPYQLAVIKDIGFEIPETFISNDNEAVQNFLFQNNEVVYKSIGSVRSIVQKISGAHLEYLDDVSWCPTLFQKFLPGINYRAHVIGNNVYTARIESDKLDYRYGNTIMIAEELPTNIADKCRMLNDALGLHFSGIDLMLTPDNKWYCFEVNTSPAYSYFQLNTGLQISKALSEFMINVDKSCA